MQEALAGCAWVLFLRKTVLLEVKSKFDVSSAGTCDFALLTLALLEFQLIEAARRKESCFIQILFPSWDLNFLWLSFDPKFSAAILNFCVLDNGIQCFLVVNNKLG